MANVLKLLQALKQLNLSLPALLRILSMLETLYPLPDYTDPKQIREWLVKFSAIADEVAAHTETTVDDELVKGLKAILASDSAWDVIGDLMAYFLAKGADFTDNLLAVDQKDKAVAAGEAVGISPATIMMIVSVAVEIIKAIRQRRNG